MKIQFPIIFLASLSNSSKVTSDPKPMNESSETLVSQSKLDWYLPISANSSIQIHASDADEILLLETGYSIAALDYEKGVYQYNSTFKEKSICSHLHSIAASDRSSVAEPDQSLFLTVSNAGNIGGWDVKGGKSVFWKSLVDQKFVASKSALSKCTLAASFHQNTVVALLANSNSLGVFDNSGALLWSWSSTSDPEYGDKVVWDTVLVDDIIVSKEETMHETILIGHFKENQTLAHIAFHSFTGEMIHDLKSEDEVDLGTSDPKFVITGHGSQFLVWLDDIGSIRGYDLFTGTLLDFHVLNEDESFKGTKEILSLDKGTKRDYFVVKAGQQEFIIELSDQSGETMLDYHLLPITPSPSIFVESDSNDHIHVVSRIWSDPETGHNIFQLIDPFEGIVQQQLVLEQVFKGTPLKAYLSTKMVNDEHYSWNLMGLDNNGGYFSHRPQPHHITEAPINADDELSYDHVELDEDHDHADDDDDDEL